MIMFKGIEDGGTNNVADTEDGIELQPLSGLDDFGSIFAWARGAARSVGTTARSGASSPFDLMPASMAKGAIRSRPSRAGYDLPFRTPRSHLSGFDRLEETVTFDVPIDGVMDDGLEGLDALGKIKLKKVLKKAKKLAVKAAVAPVVAPTKLALKATAKSGQIASKVMKKAPKPLRMALAPALMPAVAAGKIAGRAQRPLTTAERLGTKALTKATDLGVKYGIKSATLPGAMAARALKRAPMPIQSALAPALMPIVGGGKAAAMLAPGRQVPPGLMRRPTSAAARAAAMAAMAARTRMGPPPFITTAMQADVAPSPLAPPSSVPSVTSMMTADAGQVVAAAMKAEKDPFALPAAAAAAPTGKDPFARASDEGQAASGPATTAAAAAAQDAGRRGRDPFANADPGYDAADYADYNAADYAEAETVAWDEAAYSDEPEAPPADEPPEAYADEEAIVEPEYAEPDAGISPADEPEPTYVDGLGVLLGLGSFSAVRARKRLMARVPVGWVEPRDLLTKQGAAKLGSAGAKAALAAKLHSAKSKLIEQRIDRLAREGRKERDQVIRDRKAGEALSWARELLKERAAEARAARVAGGAQVALRFRAQAATASTESEQKKMLGLAAGAVMATQTYAKTKIPVKLPAMLMQATIDKLRNASPQSVPVAPPQQTTSTLLGRATKPNPAKRGLDVPQGLTAFGHGRPSVPGRPSFRQSLPAMPAARFAAQYDEPSTGFVASLRGLGADPAPAAGKGTWSFLESIKDVAKSVVGERTAVGAALRGDYKSAAEKASKFAIQMKGGKAVATGPGGKPLTADEQAVLAQIDRQSSSIMGQTLPILAVAGLGAAGLIVFLMRRKQA